MDIFCLCNNITNSSLQNHFLSGVNGTIEIYIHILKKHVAIVFQFPWLLLNFVMHLDQSPMHSLIANFLAYLKIPKCMWKHIFHLKLYIDTKQESNQRLPIKHGSTNGTLHLTLCDAFNLVIRSAHCSKHPKKFCIWF